MRTTVEITDEQRARLLQLAAARGEKGFSSLVREAIDLYLAHEQQRAEAVDRALELHGSLSEADATALAAEAQHLREHWR